MLSKMANMLRELLMIALLILSSNRASASVQPDIDRKTALCQQLLTSNLNQWKTDALQNLSVISTYPLYPVMVDPRSPAQISAALNIRPEEVADLALQSITLTVDSARLELTLNSWPRFHRALVSLKNPQVIKDFTIAKIAPRGEDTDSLKLAVRANTYLFFLIRELPLKMQLGLILPLVGLGPRARGMPTYFEFQLGVLRHCEPSRSFNLNYTNERGETVCVDDLVNFSTWPNEVEWSPE
jgi:hypothetical protein